MCSVCYVPFRGDIFPSPFLSLRYRYPNTRYFLTVGISENMVYAFILFGSLSLTSKISRFYVSKFYFLIPSALISSNKPVIILFSLWSVISAETLSFSTVTIIKALNAYSVLYSRYDTTGLSILVFVLFLSFYS